MVAAAREWTGNDSQRVSARAASIPMTDTDPIPTDWLQRAAAAHPERVALRDAEGVQLTYVELLGRAAALAEVLGGEGGVVLELEPGLGHAVAFHAALLRGMRVQTLRPGLVAAEREAVLALAGEGVALLDSDRLEALGISVSPRGRDSGPSGAENSVSGASPGSGAVLSRVLSSGTTGPRRAVDLSFANHWASAQASAANLGVEPDDRWLCCLPLDHVGGLTIPIRSAIYGTMAEIHSRFDVDAVVAVLGAGVTIVSLVPTQLHRLLEAGADLTRQRIVLIGGAPLPAVTLDEALEQGINVVQTYGLTEACSQVCTLAPGDAARKRGSSGRPLPGIEVRVEGDGEEGEILVRGPNVAASAMAADGWLHTGDLGRFDEEGYLWVLGRADDLIISGGENVRPEVVEKCLQAHPSVAEAGVYGRDDPEWGQAVVAVVVLRDGMRAEASELRDFCRGRLAPAEVPKQLNFASSLPRTGSGKLQRHRLG